MIPMLKFLRLFLSLRAEGDGAEGAESVSAEGGEEESTLDDFLDAAEATASTSKAAPKSGEEDPSVKASQEAIARAEAAERRAIEAETRERLQREQQENLQRQPVQDPQYAQEEQQIAAAKAKGDNTYWLEWQIKRDRESRALVNAVSTERFAAQEERDKSSFERIEASHPKLFQMYKEKVEQARAMSIRERQPLPRTALLRLFVGDDMVNGKFKIKTGRKAAAPVQTEVRRVARGTVPGARSDVDAKTQRNEREKRRERLRDQYI